MRGVPRGIRHCDGSHKPLARWHLGDTCHPLVPEIQKICTAISCGSYTPACEAVLDVLCCGPAVPVDVRGDLVHGLTRGPDLIDVGILLGELPLCCDAGFCVRV